MDRETLRRLEMLNQLSLTEAEKAEQKLLREEYVAGFRRNLRGILDNTYIQTPDGTKTKMEMKKK